MFTKIFFFLHQSVLAFVHWPCDHVLRRELCKSVLYCTWPGKDIPERLTLLSGYLIKLFVISPFCCCCSFLESRFVYYITK